MVPCSSWGRNVRVLLATVAMLATVVVWGTLADAAGCPTNVIYSAEGVSNLDLGWYPDRPFDPVGPSR